MRNALFILLVIKAQLMGLSKSQIAIKQLVKKESRKYSNYPATMAAICLTESSYGYYSIGDDTYKDGTKKPLTKSSLGIMQMQVPTARFIAKKSKDYKWLDSLSDKRIATLLLTDDVLAIHLATLYFEYHRKLYGYFGAVSHYNGGTNNRTYYNRVQANKGK